MLLTLGRGWTRVIFLRCGVWLFGASMSMAQAEGLNINFAFDGGLDAWAIEPKQPDKPTGQQNREGSAYNDHIFLYLPDADTQWDYRTVSPWMRFTSNIRLSANSEANFKLRADQAMGIHLDAANVEWSPSPQLGFRAGVVSFNTNWCRTYDVDSPWIMEPDVFCRTRVYMKINNAAPGLQVYANTALGEYQLQAILGAYNPMILDYATKEFGFNTTALRPNFTFNSNQKISAALNFLHLNTGTQVRLGMMRSDQAGFYSPKLTPIDRDRRNLLDNYYLGIDTYLRSSLRARYSLSLFASRDYYDGVQVVTDQNKSQTLELIYEWKSTDLFSFGWSRFSINAAVDDVAFANFKADDYFYADTSILTMAWRRQWGKGIYSALQWTRSTQTNGYEGRRRPGSGEALGLRMGYQY